MSNFLKELIDGNRFELIIDTKIFDKDIILKTAYQFLDRGYFFFKLDDTNNLVLEFNRREDNDEDPKKVIADFSDSLLEFTLRDKLEKDNKVIRETIVTKAINGPLDLDNFVSLDTDKISKQQENNQIDFDKDIDDILKEIEEDPELQINEDEIDKILKEIEEDESSLEKPNITVNPEAVKDIKEKFKK